MFETNAEELYKQYRKRFPKIPKQKLDLTFEVKEPDELEDGRRVYNFYERNAPDTMELKGLTEVQMKLLINERKLYLISAHLGGELVGQLMLVQQERYKFYFLTYPCTREDLRKRGITVYMVLCGMKFAEENLGLEDLFVLVHERVPTVKYERSLKDEIEKLKMRKPRKRLTRAQIYDLRRSEHLCRVFEEILGFRLIPHHEFICYAIRLWS